MWYFRKTSESFASLIQLTLFFHLLFLFFSATALAQWQCDAATGAMRTAHSGALPENALSVPVGVDSGTVSQQEFDLIIDTAINYYQPFAQLLGVQLIAQKLWSSSTVNAFAMQTGNTWIVEVHGGIARHQYMTPDGLAYIVCHELGHHFGGFPFYPEDISEMGSVLTWAAVEGQSDYYAAQSCLKAIWRDDPENDNYADLTQHNEYLWAKVKCLWAHIRYTRNEQGLCVRTAYSGKPLADVQAQILQAPLPDFGTPDSSVVIATRTEHPPAQCRLDTALAGALCTVPTNVSRRIIPGKGIPGWQGGKYGPIAEREAALYSCARELRDADHQSFPVLFGPWGYKPRCWYAERSMSGPFI